MSFEKIPSVDKFFSEKEQEIKFADLSSEAYFDALYPTSGVGYRYSNAFLDNFKTQDTWQKSLKTFLGQYIASYKNNPQWLVFLGERGTGKTHAACVIANELMKRYIRATYVSLPRMLADIKASYGKKENFLDKFLSVEFLVIDELGSLLLSDDDYRNLFILVDGRYMDELPTVMISNAKDLNFLGGAILDRLSECAKTVKFDTKSYRGR